MNIRFNIDVDGREFDTILAGLRMWQWALEPGGDYPSDFERVQAILEIASEHGKPLTAEDIDSLCERLNTGE